MPLPLRFHIGHRTPILDIHSDKEMIFEPNIDPYNCAHISLYINWIRTGYPRQKGKPNEVPYVCCHSR